MRIAAIFALAATMPFAGTSIAAPSRPHQASVAEQLAQRMIDALNAQHRIQVRGTTFGPGTLKTHYLLRYEAQAREYVSQTGGPWDAVKLPGVAVDGIEQIIIGKHAYTTMDGQHWYHTDRDVVPSPEDAMSLNVSGTPCCVDSPNSESVTVSDRGSGRWRGHRVRRLGFDIVSEGYTVAGTVLVDPTSFLPVQYSQSSAMPKMNGSFSISYGGSFLIAAP